MPKKGESKAKAAKPEGSAAAPAASGASGDAAPKGRGRPAKSKKGQASPKPSS